MFYIGVDRVHDPGGVSVSGVPSYWVDADSYRDSSANGLSRFKDQRRLGP